MRTLLIALIGIGLAASGAAYYVLRIAGDSPANFRMAKVKRDDLTIPINATGTLEPEEVVDVGAQVMGRILDFGIDEEVEKRISGIRPKVAKPPTADPLDKKNINRRRAGPPEVKKPESPSSPDTAAKAQPAPASPAGTAAKAPPASPSPAGTAAKVEPAPASPQPCPEGKGGQKAKDLAKRPRIDYGSFVEDGTLLARIDPEMYAAQVAQANASLLRAEADLRQAKAKRDQAKEELGRADKLRDMPAFEGVGNRPAVKAISDSDYTLVKVNYEVAEANVGVAEAVVKQAKATKDQADINLRYTEIKSPVKGVIIDRRVNIGQTVVASLNAPSLFLIAKDLKSMQVWASVNEADIGRIHEGMPVTFTVDAFPGEPFKGSVVQTRLNATITQNVVTYTVVVRTDNPDGKLLPYLTANLQFEVETHPNVLLVSNAALRWKPKLTQVVPELRDEVAPTLAEKGGDKGRPAGKSPGENKSPGESKSPGQPKAAGQSKPAKSKDRDDRGRIWVKEGNYVKPIQVQVGASDGTQTEISGSDVKEDLEVVVGENVADQGASETNNPFAPKLFKGSKQR